MSYASPSFTTYSSHYASIAAHQSEKGTSDGNVFKLQTQASNPDITKQRPVQACIPLSLEKRLSAIHKLSDFRRASFTAPSASGLCVFYVSGVTQPEDRFQTCESHRKMKTTFAKTHARPPKPAKIMKTPTELQIIAPI